MPERELRILHLVATLGAGGAEKQLFHLCSEAGDEVSHRVLAVLGEGVWADRLRAAGVPVDCLGADRIMSWRALAGVVRFLWRNRPEVVHSWLPSMNVLGTLSVLLSGMWGIRQIASIRNVDDWKPWWRRGLERAISCRWQAILCNSRAGWEQAAADGLAAAKLVHVPNGIESRTNAPDRASARRQLGLREDAFVVAAASRLVPQKRIDTILAAAQQLPGITFVIAGEGPLESYLRATATENVTFLGGLPDISPVLASADVFVSVSEREGTSNSLLEALQAGCAAVVTRAGDNALVAGGAGRVIHRDALADTLSALRDDPASLQAMRSLAPERAKLFSIRAMVERTEEIYRTGLHAAPPPQEQGPRRVLYVDYTNGIGMGGGQRSLLLLLGHLNRRRYEPLLACPPDEAWRRYVPGDLHIVDLPMHAAFRRLSRSRTGWAATVRGLASTYGSIAALRKLIGSKRVDVVHANNLKTMLIASASTMGKRVPVIWHVRDILPRRVQSRWALQAGALLATRIIAVSHAVASQFRVPATVIHNAVAMPDLSTRAGLAASFRQEQRIPQHAYVFAYVGRLDEGKGLHLLLDAFDAVAREFEDAWLVIAGEGPVGPSLTLQAKAKGVRRFRMTGFQSQPGRVFASADCVVVPSVEPDSFPRSVIEAMSWERAVIGSASGGIAEAILDGETGRVVPACDRNALRAALREVCLNRTLGARWGAAGRTICEQRFSVEHQLERIEQIYQELLSAQ